MGVNGLPYSILYRAVPASVSISVSKWLATTQCKEIDVIKRCTEIVVGFFVLFILVSSAEAINIKLAEVLGGLAVVKGKKAARDSSIAWEGAVVTAANHGGNHGG